ncbi:MAG: DUF4185 domain-containing protein [Planctomycetes bacterium]|nr:DUF4185 domain-containing protein [Planctomycetota bacterium]
MHKLLLALLTPAALGSGDEPRVYPGSTCKLEQLTGERDAARGVFTRSRTESSAGLVATDLGSSFEHDGKLYFLFGDSGGGAPHADVLAWTEAKTPDTVALSFHTDEKGQFRPLAVPGITSGPFEVPSYGISVNGAMHVVFTTDHSDKNTMGRSVLARSTDDGRTFERLFDVSTTRFINVALARATTKDHARLPSEDCVFVWGSGRYRASSVRLAYAPAKRFGERESWRYFVGMAGGAPRFDADEAQAIDLFDHPVVGELSVAWIAPLSRWVMLYNSSAPRGIVMRTAAAPWGPWSAPAVVFDPWLDKGYANFMHVDWKTARMDEFHDKGQENKWGGEYGPYLIPRFTSGDAERCTLVFSMSTWNPYQVVLMATDVGRPPSATQVSETKFLLGTPPCATQGSDVVRFERNGAPHVRTYAANGDKDLVVSHQVIQPVVGSTLAFSVHGGRARIVLVREERAPPSAIQDIRAFERELLDGKFGPVVESIAGPANNDVDVSVRWNLSRHAGKRLRVYLLDASTDRWGFVSVSEMTLQSPAPR